MGIMAVDLSPGASIMGEKSSSSLDASYIEGKRRQLTGLRDQLRSAAAVASAEEGDLNEASSLQAREYEDEAQKLDLLERAGERAGRDIARLAQVERALQKIAEGSYGLSDVSGLPIPIERLEAFPEAITTLSEQEAAERMP